MGIRLQIAKAIGAASTWALSRILHRPAANFPGKAALYADPQLIGHLRPRIRTGSVVVVGTNGKTTVTNLLADVLETAGATVACNRTGANLDSGVATALLHTHAADWGVFESDELWFARIVPQLKPDYAVLLNLFRDQLDRSGEIDHVQSAIADGLAASPETTLIYNADDPLCQAIADRVGNRRIPFGVDEDMHLAQNEVVDSEMCQRCEAMLDYDWHQYGQLGNYHCPICGFGRTEPIYRAHNVTIGIQGISLDVQAARSDHAEMHLDASLTGAYSAYNLLAVCAVADCVGVSLSSIGTAIRAFSPENGRLQTYVVDGKRILLNLAKNPTGANQNLRIIASQPGPKAVAIFINDKEADGHDVSWLWDVDFQEMATADDLVAFAGGIRRNDMQVRLKYADIDAQLVDSAADFIAKALDCAPDANLFLLANYTALPNVKAELDGMAHLPLAIDSPDRAPATAPFDESAVNPESAAATSICTCTDKQARPLRIVHMYPELLNLYGDGGNVAILAERARERGISVEIDRVEHGRTADIDSADIVFLGGGPDREQHLASIELLNQVDSLRSYVEDDGVLLAICGGYQILGRNWLLGDESVPGLGILDIETRRAEGGSHNRLIGNIALESPLAHRPVIGYENHAGRTFLGSGCEPFGSIIGRNGKGNNDYDGVDGARYRNVLGTYLHGPLLAKNPEIADWLIAQALARRASKEGRQAPLLASLDDAVERAANEFMCAKLGIRV